MKTVFKKGMVVYDQINYPNKKGKVVDTESAIDEDDYPIEVEFEDNYPSICYTLDGRFDLESIPTLSTKPYEVDLKGFEQKAPAIIYESIRAEGLKKGEYVAILNGLELPDERTAKAFEALAKLIWIRDYYNEGWQPDWKDKNNDGDKYCIMLYKEDLIAIEYSYTYEVLHFKTPEIRDKFLKEQKELLEIAKPLL